MKRCELTIFNHHSLNGEKTESKVNATGDFHWDGDNGSFKIVYKEELEEAVESLTTIDFRDMEHISISRSGPLSPNLELVKNKAKECKYETPFGDIAMIVTTDEIKSNVTAEGGTLEIAYNIDFNNGDISDNNSKITIKEIH